MHPARHLELPVQPRPVQRHRTVPDLHVELRQRAQEGRVDRGVVEARGIGLRHLLTSRTFIGHPLPQPAGQETRPFTADLGGTDHQAVLARQGRTHGHGRVQHDQPRHGLAAGLQLARDLQRGQAAAGKARDQIGALRLDLADLLDAAGGSLGQGLVRGGVAEQAAGLQAPDRAVGRQALRQRPQVQHVAEHARDDEQRRAAPGGALAHRHQMGKAGRLRRRHGHDLALGAVGARTDPRLDQGGQGRDVRGLEQRRQRQVHRIGLADHREQPHRDQRMAAQVKEPVIDAHLLHAQQVAEKARDAAFQVGPRLDIVAVQVRTLKAGAGAGGAGTAAAGLLRDQLRQVHAGDRDLRQARLQRQFQQRGSACGRNALRDHARQPFLTGPCGLGHVGSARGQAHRGGGVQAAQGQPLDLDQDAALRIGQRHVEAGIAVRRIGQRHKAGDGGGQRRVHGQRAIGQRHPQLRPVIAGDQVHGPARRDVHQRRVQHEPAVQIGQRRIGQAQLRQALARAHPRCLQHAPARTKGHLTFLRGFQGMADGGTVHPHPRGQRQQVQRRAGGFGGGDATFGHGDRALAEIGLDQKACGFLALRQGHAEIAGAAILDRQRVQEGQVAQGPGRMPPRRLQRLRRQFDGPRAGKQRHPVAGAVFGDDPVGCRQPAAKAVDRVLAHMRGQ